MNEYPVADQVEQAMQYVTPIANLVTISRNQKLATLYQHPSVEKTVAGNFNLSTSQSANVLSSLSHTTVYIIIVIARI